MTVKLPISILSPSLFEASEDTWEQVKKKKENPKQSGPKPKPPPEIQATSFSSPPILTQPLPSTSNPFESLEEEDPSSPHSPPDPQEPPLPESQCQDTIESSFPLTISSQPLLDPPLSKENKQQENELYLQLYRVNREEETKWRLK